eukprot:Blabericola_migrator_1__92@NODE_1022_length_5670_cov_110_763520_g702_i0_p2_GENE_NODE_1022_length_5670_cov_110_763520_g702_i0NODE_1022_length_5670_cov_110_763520_g702_i0_p2_ORF_typecomplete_len273_score28_82_NODE_1022_length_5670_cov_110_763520_g702_i044045222
MTSTVAASYRSPMEHHWGSSSATDVWQQTSTTTYSPTRLASTALYQQGVPTFDPFAASQASRPKRRLHYDFEAAGYSKRPCPVPPFPWSCWGDYTATFSTLPLTNSFLPLNYTAEGEDDNHLDTIQPPPESLFHYEPEEDYKIDSDIHGSLPSLVQDDFASFDEVGQDLWMPEVKSKGLPMDVLCSQSTSVASENLLLEDPYREQEEYTDHYGYPEQEYNVVLEESTTPSGRFVGAIGLRDHPVLSEGPSGLLETAILELCQDRGVTVCLYK